MLYLRQTKAAALYSSVNTNTANIDTNTFKQKSPLKMGAIFVCCFTRLAWRSRWLLRRSALLL